MLGVLHFNNSPGVETTTDLLPLHLNQLVGANHSKGNACLGEEDKGQDPQRETKSRGRHVENKGNLSLNQQREVSDVVSVSAAVPLSPSGLWSAP